MCRITGCAGASEAPCTGCSTSWIAVASGRVGSGQVGSGPTRARAFLSTLRVTGGQASVSVFVLHWNPRPIMARRRSVPEASSVIAEGHARPGGAA
uniref:Uncharacterized protein n=1 Tax=Physcomitrium patens TaxID=3218 RepID=A0A2K1IZZ0_PHYPA|nr:hypothetical protein PHYPA_022736 [Physcomitrium patens]